jgi:hypothetical protein
MILKFEDDQRALLGILFDPGLVTLLKGDLSKAFTLLSFSSDSVELTASELYQPQWDPLTAEQQELMDALLNILGEQREQHLPPLSTPSWSMLYHTGSFGMRILPFVFGVVSRVLLFLLALAMYGYVMAYVDDYMAVTLSSHLGQDFAIICEVTTLLLGPHAVEWTKWYAGRQAEWIGWMIDLDTRTVSLGRKNLLKVLYGFFSFDTSRYIQGSHLLRLASYASRYTTVLQPLTPFTTLLYSQTNGLKNLDAYISLTESTQVAVWIWRATLLHLVLHPTSFSRPLDSFRDDVPHYLIEYDSSLEGTGLLIEPLTNRDNPHLIPTTLCGQACFPFDCAGDSSYQNTCELIPVVIGCVELATRGVRHARLALRGDSITSLAWSMNGHYTGSICARTAVVLSQITVHFDLTIVETHHIPGEENTTCDALSRMFTTPEELGYSASTIISAHSSSYMADLLLLCDPTSPTPFSSSTTFNEFWGLVQDFIHRLDTGMY